MTYQDFWNKIFCYFGLDFFGDNHLKNEPLCLLSLKLVSLQNLLQCTCFQNLEWITYPTTGSNFASVYIHWVFPIVSLPEVQCLTFIHIYPVHLKNINTDNVIYINTSKRIYKKELAEYTQQDTSVTLAKTWYWLLVHISWELRSHFVHFRYYRACLKQLRAYMLLI